MGWFDYTVIVMIVIGGLVTIVDPISKEKVVQLEREHHFDLILRQK